MNEPSVATKGPAPSSYGEFSGPVQPSRVRQSVDMAELKATFPDVLKSTEVKSLLKKYLTPALFDALKDKKTSRGFTIWNIINNGIQQPKSSVGVYAPDEESYHIFSALFNPVIEDFHAPYKITDGHISDTDPGNLKAPGNELDKEGKYIVSSRIAVVRNIRGYGLSPALTKVEREEMEEKVVGVLNSFTGDFTGTYHPLYAMEEAEGRRLAEEELLFERDSFLDGTGVNRDWPAGRGVFYNEEKTLLVWIGEEEQLSITSMQAGGDIAAVFSRLCRITNELEARLGFQLSPFLGYLTGCPTNLGTGMRACVRVKMSLKVTNHPDFAKICQEFNIQGKSIGGEICEISNGRKLGLSEVKCVQDMYNGIKRFLEIEKAEHKETSSL